MESIGKLNAAIYRNMDSIVNYKLKDLPINVNFNRRLYMKVKQKLLALGLSFSIVIAAMPIVNALSSVDTIQGIDRYETAALIADKQEYTTAILVNSDKSLADGLSASGLAGVTDSPILLTQKDKIPNITVCIKSISTTYSSRFSAAN